MKVREKHLEVSLSKRLAAALILVSYIGATAPLPVIASEITSVQGNDFVEESAEELITPEEGGCVILGNARIEIPEGAVKKATRISITRLKKVSDTGESLYNATPKSGGYRFLPAGTKFEKEAVITLPYSSELNAKPQSLEDLYTYFYDTKKMQWVKLERLEVDKENCLVRSLTTHFTDMINATLTLPESASPVDVNLNSIKNLEAAKPDGHLIKFNQPNASNTGDASFSFELGIPAGRRGMQPQVSVSYSSAGGNGIMGKGFDVNYGSLITTDTRFGLPEYNTHDIYMLDGIILREVSRDGTTVIYEPEKQTSFSRIRRFGAGTDSDYWEVTDKNGTKQIYAQSISSCTGSGKTTFAWHITKTIDVFGNYITYEYENDGGYVYPLLISYTGHGNEKGNYKVTFCYDEENVKRSDVRSEARSRKLIYCRRLLTSIKTSYKENEAIRRYSFEYKEGLGGTKMMNVLKVENNAGESYSYSFDYHEFEKDDSGNIKYFADATLWENGKPLTAGGSENSGSNFNVSAGVGYGLRYIDARVSGGLSGSSSSSSSHTDTMLLDIDGDGRADSVRQSGKTIYVAINKNESFSEETAIRIKKGSFDTELDSEKSKTSTFGWNIYGGGGLKAKKISASFGSSYSQVYQKTSSDVSCSFMDMDRDGLVDIVETGKTSYLRNLGNLEFEEVPVYSDVSVKDVSQTIPEDKIKKFKETYFVQTPFRMWKAPYDGVINIKESAAGIPGSYKPESPVIIKTFYKNEEAPLLRVVVPVAGTIDISKDEMKINKDDDLYFISDSGEEPKDSDINWNLNIDYSKIRLFKNNYPLPVICRNNLPDNYVKSYSKSLGSSSYTANIKPENDLDDAKKSFIENELKNPVLLRMYEITYSDVSVSSDESKSNYTASFSITFTFNNEWADKNTEESRNEIFECLCGRGNILPGVLTHKQFDRYLSEIEDNTAFEKNKDFYDDFAMNFTHSVAEDVFILKITDEEKLKDFSIKYPMSKELLKECLSENTINGIKPVFTSQKAVYKNKVAVNQRVKSREEFDTGVVFAGTTGKESYVILGKNSESLFVYDIKHKKILSGLKESLNPVLFEYEVEESVSSENNLKVKIGIRKDSEDVYESSVTLDFRGLSYRPEILTKDEYSRIYKDITVPFSDARDSHWKIDTANPVKPGEEDLFFKDMELSEDEKERIIEALYELKETEAELDEDGNVITPAITCYVQKDNADYETVQNILDSYRKKTIEEKLFPFYEENVGFMILRDEWKKEKSDNEFSDEASRSEYQKLNTFLVSQCRKFNIGSYRTFSVSQIFENEHLYDVLNDESCSIIMVENDISFSEKKIKPEKVKWNSESDFSSEDKSTKKEIYSCTTYVENIKDYAENVKEYADDIKLYAEDITDIENDEFLYGGKNCWFYGLWKGSQNAYPFSGEKLTEFRNKSVNVSSQEEFERLKSERTVATDETASESNVNQSVYFYLPQTKSGCEMLKDVDKVESATVNYRIDYNTALLGTVYLESEMVTTENGKNNKNRYAMPFIYKDVIHTERAGGNAFYNVEGLYKKTEPDIPAVTGARLALPSVRRTFTEGDDITPSVSAGIGTYKESENLNNAIKALEDENKNKSASAYREASEFISLSVSKGRNDSTSITSQSMQDMNGDGVPDIIQASDGAMTVIYGKKLSETGEISYKKSDVHIDRAYAFSKNSTVTSTFGASVNAGGAVQVVTKGLGKANAVPLPSPFPSGGESYSTGSNEQKKGFLDINGDGLPDYFGDSVFCLSLGESYGSPVSDWPIGNITSNTSKSYSQNFTALTIGTGGSIDFGKANSLSSGASASIGGSVSASTSTVTKMMTDINGDGLPDILTITPGSTVFNVSYNTGNGFEAAKPASLGSWNWDDLSFLEQNAFKKLKDGEGLNLHFMQNVPIVGSAIAAGMDSKPSNPYGRDAKTLINNLDWSSTVSLGLNASLGGNVNIGINLFVPFYIGTINITFSTGTGMTSGSSVNGASVKLTDLDGDGLPDHVLRIPGTATYWKRNLLGGENLIEKINLPQGGNIEIKYAEMHGTTDNPGFKYVMSEVTVNDGTDSVLPAVSEGEHSVTTSYSYKDGWYDRQRKENFGYRTVTTLFADGTKKVDFYNNRDYYAKGSLESSCTYSSDEKLLSKSKTVLHGAPVALPEKEESWTYEVSSEDEYIYSCTEYKYDGYGNCTKITQSYGDGVRLIGKIEYDNKDWQNYIIGLPLSILVEDENGTKLRYRSGIYNEKGQLTELKQYYNNSDYAENKLTYDRFGNISSVTDSRGAKLSYTYDSKEHMFVTGIEQKGNNTDSYTSSIEYDIPTQTKSWEKDCNNNKLTYKYDKWQRIEKIFTSYDTGTTPAVSYEYHTPSSDTDGKHDLWYALTNNKVTFDAEDDSVIQTVLQIDGVGRAVRTAKTGFVNGVDGWNASGAVEYDSKGRSVKEGMTEFIEGTLEALLKSKPEMTSLFTSYEYDQKDRKVKTILPDESVQTNAFYIEENRQISEAKDPNENISIQETDSRGNIVRVAKEDSSNHQLTEVTYEYNAMGEMLKAFDAKKHPVSVEYDLLGRKTALESLDSGRQEFFYDKSSNLVKETNSVLREHNKQILYEYDGLNRLVKIDYPETKDTLYTYGGVNAANGAAGKILKLEDASGTIEYEYGCLGEVTKETRTLKTYLGSGGSSKAVMEYRSDYLERMQWIVYPDGEKVTYGYDRGGQVVSVTGEHFGNDFEYVTDILYDQYGQRTRIDYGNGTFTEYNYDPARRWLDTIKTQNKWGQSYQNITYSFDHVGNVLGYENNCLDAVTGNYKTSQTYSYNNLYQLIKAEGYTTYNPYSSSVPEFESEYTQEFEFDSDGLGNMMSKVSKESVTPQKTIGDNINYSFNYVYDKDYAHRLLSAGDRYYQYDANGNVICEQDGSFEEEKVEYHKVTEEAEGVYSTDYAWAYFNDDNKTGKTTRYHRTYTWDEKNRLINSTDSSYNTSYVYGQDGQRSNKYTQSSETLYFNKMWTFHTDSGNSVYGGQTAKNIYLGETRIVTKLNSGTEPTYQEEYYKQYYYHSDHLGSASLISDSEGNEYQRIEYTPYGETWVEKTNNTGLEFLPYKFTAKELDEETGLYYYGARYLDPKYSRWISTDPALGDYIPQAPINDEARKHNQNLPGMGGIFNHINANLFAYAANNPVHYTDPDGNTINNAYRTLMKSADKATLGKSSVKIKDQGCVLTAYTRMASAILGKEISLSEANKIGVKNNLFSGKEENLLTPENGAALVNAILKNNGVTDTTITFEGSYEGEEALSKYLEADSSDSSYFATIRVSTHDADGNKYDHTMNLDGNAYSYGECGENIKVNDTSGVRQQLADDPSGRKNKFLRMDFFIINKPQGCSQE